MRNTTKKTISLSILGASLVVCIGAAAGVGLNLPNYNEYNTYHDLYNVMEKSNKSSTLHIDMTFKEFVKKENKAFDSLTSDQIVTKKQEAKNLINMFNNADVTTQDAIAKNLGISTKDCKYFLTTMNKVNYVEANKITFLGSFISMFVFVIIALGSGIAYTKVNSNANHALMLIMKKNKRRY